MKQLVFRGFSIPDNHRIQLNFDGVALNYRSWKPCFSRLVKMNSEGSIDLITFTKCCDLINTYLK